MARRELPPKNTGVHLSSAVVLLSSSATAELAEAAVLCVQGCFWLGSSPGTAPLSCSPCLVFSGTCHEYADTELPHYPEPVGSLVFPVRTTPAIPQGTNGACWSAALFRQPFRVWFSRLKLTG